MRNYLILALVVTLFVLSGCSTNTNSETGPFPATEIITNEPVVIGYIIEVLEEDQAIVIKSGVTKEEAMKSNKNDTGYDVHTFFSNATPFDGELVKGYKVAVWQLENQEAIDNLISERIVVLEK